MSVDVALPWDELPLVADKPFQSAASIVQIETGMLQRHPANPRLIKDDRFKALRDALEAEPTHMMARPLTVTQDGLVVAGNMRLEAAKALGWATVPAWVQHFDDTEYDQARLKAWMLRDNEEYGEWVPDQLAQLVYEISQTSLPLSLIGFDDDVTKRILMDVAGEGGPGGVGQADDDAGEPDEGEADSQRGVVYNLGAHRLMCGDTLDPAQVAKLCAGERISMIFTSPPYTDQRTYGGDVDLSPEHLATFFDAWAPHCDGPICVNLGMVRKEHRVVRYWDTYIAAAERAGLELFSWNIWDRGQPWAIGAQVAEFAIEHEWIFVFDTKKRTLNRTVPNKSAGEKGGGSQRQADGTQHRGANRRTAMGIRTIQPFRQLGTVFRSRPEHSPSGHPAAFPVDLPFTYIEAATSEGDIVADPFMGGGTTLIAAARAGRVCLGMEIEPKYVDLARDRYERQA